ncbi:MAG: hypothetical protein D6775_16550 [Caldilineae bacterium]|nr:MAG: hypothetical protein D6775_16550 [Caldilineae bacterium]
MQQEHAHDSPLPSELTPPGRSVRTPLFWAMLTLTLVLFLTGVALIGYYWLLTREDTTPEPPANAWTLLRADQILPGLALWSLAEYPAEQEYRQAMGAEAIETATAAAITRPELPGVQRLGWLTVLARRQAGLGERNRALQLYSLAMDLAMLEPELGQHTRANTLLDVAAGLAELDDEAATRRALDQVVLIAVNSGELTASVRRQMLEDVASVYEQIGDLKAAAAIRALAINSPTPRRPSTTIDPLQVLQEPLEYPDDLADFRRARVAQAQTVINTWLAQNGQVSRVQWSALEAALIDEDLVRRAFYEQQFAREDLTPAMRARLLWDQVQWLLIKYRAARGLFGTELVANWVAELPAIRQQLNDTFAQLASALLEHIDTMRGDRQAEARYSLYRHLLIWARIGLYPDADRVFLANALNESLQQWSQADGILPAADVTDSDRVRIFLKVVHPR